MHLLVSQKNDIFLLAERYGLSPADFVWQDKRDASGLSLARLFHSPTQSFFGLRLRGQSGDQDVIVRPARMHRGEDITYGVSSWPKILELAGAWLKRVKSEHVESDLWLTAAKGSVLQAPAVDDLENTPFSADERTQVLGALAELRQFIEASGKRTDEQLRLIDSRLAQIETASGKLGRKDWILLALGGVVNLAVGLPLSPDVALSWMRSFEHLFGWIVSNVSALPPAEFT